MKSKSKKSKKHEARDDSQRAGTFLSDVKTLRHQARKKLEEGAVTAGYQGERTKLIELLNICLATEIVCVLRYRRHHFMAEGLAATSVAEEFLAHAIEEQAHADRISSRIVQLGGEPDYAPDRLTQKAHSEYVEGKDLVEMIREDLIAERIAIDSYGEIIRYIGDSDSTTRRLLEEILSNEEEHAEDMKSLLARVDSRS